MGIIRQLDYETAVLVAAGEMIERPLSVVKELVENSIDAGATKLTVEIQNGGVTLIRCSDNGCGMAKEDLPLSIKRNATSKIRTSHDIASIMTLGFRGEALASIAAVADLRIRSKRKEDKYGTQLEIHPGMDTPSITEAPMTDGTTIIVENLFANLPARRKFLKKDQTEASHVADLFERLALSNPSVSMTLIIDGKMRYSTPGDGNLYHAIYSACGAEFATKLIELSYKNDVKMYGGSSVSVSVHGYVGTPDNNFGNRQNQIFYVNGRHVRSRCLQAALEESYTSYLDTSRFPAAVMFVEVPPEFVDVNIHPTKLEVKFVAEKPIFEAVFYAVRGALERHIPRPKMALQGKSVGDVSFELARQLNAFVPIEDRSEPSEKRVYNNQRNVKQGQISFSELLRQPTEDTPPHVTRTPEIIVLPRDDSTVEYKMTQRDVPTDAAQTMQEMFLEPLPRELEEKMSALDGAPVEGQKMVLEKVASEVDEQLMAPRVKCIVPDKRPSQMTEAEFDEYRRNNASSTSDKRISLPDVPTEEDFKSYPRVSVPKAAVKIVPEYKILGEAFLSYLFIEVGDRVMVIDKHAAHERIIFEELKANVKESLSRGNIPRQLLLTPLLIPMSAELADTVSEYERDISAIGYEFTVEGRTASVTAIPTSLELAAARDVFETIADKLASGTGSAEITRDTLFEKALYQASCKAAIKVGREYDIEHLKWICDKLLVLDDIKVCPHGRPVAFEMTKAAIERQFKRI